jgi:heme a synthase
MSIIDRSPHKAIIYWLFTGCFLIWLMVVIGCITRLTHSGLSITDWSFMGSVPPMNEQMWQERFARYQESPEFRKVNFEMTIDEFKPIFFWEYVHRMTGRLIGYVFVGGCIFFLLRKKITRDMWPWLAGLFILGALQGVIGWWMVYSGLRDKPAVSHYRLATHLISAFTLFAFTFMFALKLINRTEPPARAEESRRLRPFVIVFFALLILQIIYGAFTAGYVEGDATHFRPGHIFNNWPKMGEGWMPEQVTMKPTVGENLLENASGIQFVHRNLAYLIVVVTCFVWYRSNRLHLNHEQKSGVTLLIYGVTLQVMLGIFTLVYQVPVVLGVLHQSGAFFVFAASIYLLFHLYYPAIGNRATLST